MEQLVFRSSPGPGQLPELSTSPLLVWQAPGRVAVRGVVVYEVSVDPITPAGGASQILCGLNAEASRVDRLFGDNTIGQLNLGRVIGAGAYGAESPGGTSGPNPNGDGGVVLVPQGEQNGVDPDNGFRDGVALQVDTGTATGGMFLELEYRHL
ncbi:MAG: hypothetical protein ACOCUS_05420 [Polyangiales bacterium]